MEIYLDGEWGTITGNGAGDVDAHVVCRELGYDTHCELVSDFVVEIQAGVVEYIG